MHLNKNVYYVSKTCVARKINLSTYKINKLQQGKYFVPYLRTRWGLYQKSNSFAAFVCFLILQQ